MKPKKGDTIVCWFSCGAASAIALEQTIKQYGDICTIRAVNNPVAEEDDDNRRFMLDVGKWLNIEIEVATNSKWPTNACVDVWEKKRFMSSPYGAPCTAELKKGARQYWEQENEFDWLVMGFTSEEAHRANRFRKFERENLLTPLIDGNLAKSDCFIRLMGAGIALPSIYRRGYPNANCIGCVKSSSPTYWNHVRKEDPDVFWHRAKQSRDIGVKLVKVHPKHLPFCHNNGKVWIDNRTGDQITTIEKDDGKIKYNTPPMRVFLDELPESAYGGPMKDLNFECGIFCEER